MNTEFHLTNTRAITRRTFFNPSGLGLGAIALGSLLGCDGFAAPAKPKLSENPLTPKAPPLPAKIKSVIYLHMSGVRRVGERDAPALQQHRG